MSIAKTFFIRSSQISEQNRDKIACLYQSRFQGLISDYKRNTRAMKWLLCICFREGTERIKINFRSKSQCSPGAVETELNSA